LLRKNSATAVTFYALDISFGLDINPLSTNQVNSRYDNIVTNGGCSI